MKPSPPARAARLVPIISRREAFEAASWSLATGKRREKSDPTMPAKVTIGPHRYGYRLDEWESYLAAMPRVAADAVSTHPVTVMAKEAAAASVASRRAAKVKDAVA